MYYRNKTASQARQKVGEEKGKQQIAGAMTYSVQGSDDPLHVLPRDWLLPP